MKKTTAFAAVCFSAIQLFAQKEPEPFIIKGRFTNCPEKYLKIFFEDDNGESLADTIRLDESGNFFLKTWKVTHPQRTSIQQNNIQLNDFFVAPGYNLTITGNAHDFRTLQKTKVISGVGAESNRYRFLLDSIAVAHPDPTNPYQLNDTLLLKYIHQRMQLNDSVANAVFNKPAVADKYLGFFGEMAAYDNLFWKLYMLVMHVNMHNFNYEKSVRFVRNNFDTALLDNICQDKFLISDFYKSGFINSEYLKYLVKLDCLQDSSLRNKKGYRFEKANNVYNGKVRELVLYKLMESGVYFSNSFAELNEYKTLFDPYYSTFTNLFYKTSLALKITQKETGLASTQTGRPAPVFILQSNRGKKYSLEDFRGKIVYLDLWASWCKPCRAEIPGFKKLYAKYKKNNKIAFISIAVSDGVNEWLKALEADKPEWLQLLDKDGFVSKHYVANTIPKFILINKQGAIIDFDAPAPSSGEELEKLLNHEIAK